MLTVGEISKQTDGSEMLLHNRHPNCFLSHSYRRRHAGVQYGHYELWLGCDMCVKCHIHIVVIH